MPEPLVVAQPLPFRRLVDEGMRLWRPSLRTVYPPFAVGIAGLTLVLQVGQVLLFRDLLTVEEESFSPFALGGVALLGIAALLPVMWLYGVMKVRAAQVVAGQGQPLGSSFSLLLRPVVLWTVFLQWLCVAVGYLFCFLPGVYIGLAFSFVLPVIALEGSTGTRALSRSFELARYNPSAEWIKSPLLKLLAIYFLGVLLAWLASMVVQLPATVVQQVVMLRRMAQAEAVDPQTLMTQMAWINIPGQILGTLVQVATTLYVDIVVVLLYLGLRNRKEGRDLEQALDRLLAKRGSPEAPARTTPELPPEAENRQE